MPQREDEIRARLERINHKRRVPVIRRQLDEQRGTIPAHVTERRAA